MCSFVSCLQGREFQPQPTEQHLFAETNINNAVAKLQHLLGKTGMKVCKCTPVTLNSVHVVLFLAVNLTLQLIVDMCVESRNLNMKSVRFLPNSCPPTDRTCQECCAAKWEITERNS